jgi:hypothetical protein
VTTPPSRVAVTRDLLHRTLRDPRLSIEAALDAYIAARLRAADLTRPQRV